MSVRIFAVLMLLSGSLLPITGLSQHTGGAGKTALFFSAVNGTSGKPDTLVWTAAESAGIRTFKLSGSGKSQFSIIADEINKENQYRVIVSFRPLAGRIGIDTAALVALGAGGQALETITLTGLSARGLEGENEPPLSRVFDALGYRINLGWTSLANHCEPELQGDELPAGSFKKAGDGPVSIRPVARYSPDFELPFGFYINGAAGPEKHPVGALALAGQYPEHQALFPRSEGDLSFDPGTAPFGFYVSGPDHTAYSEDRWNKKYHPENVAHASRVYQAKDKNGKIIRNAYFLCFEEASNGDYNDYVFLVGNIIAVK